MISNRKPSPALVVAMLALIAGLAGTAWAAGLAKNSVKSKQIKDNAIQSIDVADGSLGATDVADRSLGPADLEAPLATKTSTARLRPTPPRSSSCPSGVGAVLGRCSPTVASIGYTNTTTSEQAVATVVRPVGTGTGGSQSAGPVKPEGTSVSGAEAAIVEGRLRIAGADQYVDADVLFSHPASDSSTCEAWVRITVSPLATG